MSGASVDRKTFRNKRLQLKAINYSMQAFLKDVDVLVCVRATVDTTDIYC